MKRLFLLFEFLVFLSIGYSQSSSFYFNVHAPKFVSVNSSFNVCVITRLPDIPIDELDFYLLVDNKLSLEEAYCICFDHNQILEFINTDIEGIYERAYKINFALPDSLHKFAPSYEFLFDFSSNGSKHSEISFMLDVKYQGESFQTYSSMNYFNSNILLPKAKIEFFDPQE